MDTNNKRVKREIANSNERRRMQSINAGFQKLKRLLPVNDGEKISKANILQQASDYIQQVEKERLMLYKQNTLLRGVLIDIKNGSQTIESIDLASFPAITINQPIAQRNKDDSAHTNDTLSNEDTEDDCATARTTPTVNVPQITTSSATTTSTNPNSKVVVTTATTVETTTTVAITAPANLTPSTRRKPTETRLNGRRSSDNNSSSNNNNSINNHIKSSQTKTKYHQMNNTSVDYLSSRVSVDGSKSGLAAKAAIALPLEVPYTSETAIRVGQQHPDLHQDVSTTATRKILKTESMSVSHSTPKSQTLDTICKAIMEIEGDRVFKDENMRHENT